MDPRAPSGPSHDLTNRLGRRTRPHSSQARVFNIGRGHATHLTLIQKSPETCWLFVRWGKLRSERFRKVDRIDGCYRLGLGFLGPVKCKVAIGRNLSG
jgi:hypothetical protein